MKFKDLREYISFLEQKGELRRISAPVDCELEITEIADRIAQSGNVWDRLYSPWESKSSSTLVVL